MDFKRFLDININEDNKFIIFKNNKILYEPELKTFLLDGAYLDLTFNNSLVKIVSIKFFMKYIPATRKTKRSITSKLFSIS